VLVEEVSTPFRDVGAAIRRDGLEMLLASNRPGTLGALDLWVATRSSTLDRWSEPVHLGASVNSAADEDGPALSFGGTALYFSSNRAGTMGPADLRVSTRGKM
jgi:hypothetical protein